MVLIGSAVACPGEAQMTGRLRGSSASTESKTSGEITVSGAVSEVSKKQPSGAPAGFNLSMTGSQHGLNVNLGPNLDKKIRQELQAGQAIQVVGSMQSFQGGDYLVAREITINGKQLEIRNGKGFPNYSVGNSTVGHRKYGNTLNGGAR
jgi:hypothetical protein